VLPSDDRLVRDLMLHKRTEKYIRQNQSTTQQETVRRILHEKSFQNKNRLGDIRTQASELISRAIILVSGEETEINSSDPRSRIILGFNELVVKTYPNLRMLRQVNYQENDITRYLAMTRNTLPGSDGDTMSEAEHEVLAFIQSNHRMGVKVTLKSLEEKFSKRPYGWYLAAIQCVLAKLCGRDKVELRSDSNILEDQHLERALTNTHGFPNVILEPYPDVPASQVRALKDFYSNFFDHPPTNTEARTLGRETGEAFRTLLGELEVLAAQVNPYPFLAALDEPLANIRAVIGQPYIFYLTELRQHEDRLLDAKEDVLDPLRHFMSGPNKTNYDDARRFARRQEPNFSAVNSEQPQQLQSLLNDPLCYRGNQMQQAKSLMEALRVEINSLVQQEQANTLDSLDQLQAQMQQMDDYAALSAEQQAQLTAPFDQLQRDIQQQNLIAVIHDSLSRFRQQEFSRLLTQMSAWAQAQRDEDGQDNELGTREQRTVEYVTQRQLSFTFPKAILTDEADVEQYLAQLKEAMVQAINEGKRIQI